MLTVGAIKGRTAALDDAPDAAAAAARLAFAIVNRELFGEIAELAVGADEILERRAACLDRLVEHRADRFDKSLQPIQRYRSCCALRVDSGAIQRLTDVDVAKPRNDALIAEEELDCRSSAAKPGLQVASIKLERLRPERLERRPLLQLVRRDEVDRAETPGIVKRESRA